MSAGDNTVHPILWGLKVVPCLVWLFFRHPFIVRINAARRCTICNVLHDDSTKFMGGSTRTRDPVVWFDQGLKYKWLW